MCAVLKQCLCVSPGYGLYPIAEIKGMGYDELCAALPSGAKPGDLIGRSDIGSSEMNSIRSAAEGHDVSTFTYHWLLGMASATDSRGITTSFSYDSFGRFNGIYDMNGFILKQIEYSYKNQK